MNWNNGVVGFITWMVIGIGFLVYEKKQKPKYKLAYQFLRFISFSALFWVNLLLVSGNKDVETIIAYILASFITTIMTIREYDKE